MLGSRPLPPQYHGRVVMANKTCMPSRCLTVRASAQDQLVGAHLAAWRVLANVDSLSYSIPLIL